MKRNNFHTHVFRCGHAVGDEERMVQAAIENGLVELGFSCHIPMPRYRRHLLKGTIEERSINNIPSFIRKLILGGPNMRMPYSQRHIHLKEVQRVKEKYKDEIQIFQGFEAEYFEDYQDYYQELLDSNTVEYLILGHHFDRSSINERYYGRAILEDKDVLKYASQVVQALETNLYSYVCHPDLFMIGKRTWSPACQEATTQICKKAKELSIPLELNSGGIRRGLREIEGVVNYPYPYDEFWKIASEIGNDVVLGIDAHFPNNFKEENYQNLELFAKRFSLHVIENFTFRKGKSNK
ncbi:histidinol-phosphatase [Tannockella kyphosi]|uniref:histidinol-phosphatase n=1 Tax=Tannockella kyphosi TaxID=2899121 RepID=UPI002011BBA4|nr:histidinol-phosphatase [Tannockella kyphosi]